MDWETIKIKVSIHWFWLKASAPTQETQHIKGSNIGNASICAPTSSISNPSSIPFTCLPILFSHFLLLSPISRSLLLPVSPPSPLFCLFLLHSPPSPPLYPSVSTRQRVIHLHWGDTCAVLTVRALTEREEGKQQPHDSKDTLSVGKHIRPSITEDHRTPPTLWVLDIVTAVWFDDPPSLERC